AVSVAGDGVTATPSILTFTRDAWNTKQTVTVAAATDDDEDEERATISHAATGANYTGVTGPDVAVQVLEAPTRIGQVRFRETVAQADGSVVGRLEVGYHGVWGTVCDDRMAEADNLAAAAACRLLGYAGGELTGNRNSAAFNRVRAQSPGTYYPGKPLAADIVPIWLDDLRCHAGSTHWTGDTPSRLDQCNHAGIGLHNCKRPEDVWLACSGSRGGADLVGNAPALRIRDARATEGDDANMTFKVVLGTVLNGTETVSVDWATEAVADGTPYLGVARNAATAGADYTTKSGKVTFTNSSPRVIQFASDDAPTIMVETVSVPIVDDAVEDSGEIFRVRLSNIVGTNNGDAQFADATAFGIIFNDDSETGIGASFADVPATHDGSAFNVRLDFGEAVEATAATVAAALETTGGSVAVAGHDAGTTRYWTLTLTPADAATAVTLTLKATTSCEAEGAVCTSDGRWVKSAASVTVAAAPPPQPALSVADAAGDEGDTASFAVTLDRAAAATVTVSYATADGTATAGEDYSSTSGTLSFAAGERSKTVSVALATDGEAEDDETFTLTLSDPSGATLADASATGTVRNVTPPPALSVADAAGDEGGTASFVVTLDRAAAATVTVSYATADGTATAGEDYSSTSGTLSFAAGERSKTVSVALSADDEAEDDETFTLTLSNPSGATLADASATGTVRNVTPQPALSVADAAGDEGGTASFAVTLDRAAAETVDVFYTTAADTATAGADFATTTGTVSFAPGELSKTVAVALLDDDEVEFDETFRLEVVFANDVDYADPTGIGTIRDTDSPSVRLHAVPTEHGGAGERFTAGLEFSEEIDDISYKWVKETLAVAANGKVKRAQRLQKNPIRNLGWRLTVEPSSSADVTLSLTPGLRVPDGRPLRVGPPATVRGPAASTAHIDGTLLTLVWPAARDAFGTPAGTDWAVAVNGEPRAVAAAEIAGRRALLVLSTPVAAADAVTVGYVGSAMHPLADASATVRSAPWDGVAVENATGVAPSRLEFIDAFNTALVGDGLVPSRLESVDTFKTGDHKGRPYEARPESVDAFNTALVGDGLVPSRLESVDTFKTGDHKGRPYEAR
ncbi:MAG: SwmB domain-containing protein, partial [bacterium]|nr:SwmB domain-containing protein [bacterium]